VNRKLLRLTIAVRKLLGMSPFPHHPSWRTQLHRPEPLTRHDGGEQQHSLDGGVTWHAGWPPQWRNSDDDDTAT
jgi:hypothetical protein